MAQSADRNAEGFVGLMLRLRAHGISDADWLRLVEDVPHANFVPVQYFDKAWQESRLPIACGQTMHSPDITLRLINALRLEAHHNVLEIGTGSGYQTALLAKMSNKVHSIDRYAALINQATQRLARLGISNVTFAQEDGQNGSSGQGLYDRIIADTAYQTMPRPLLEQLTSGGIVITAIGEVAREQMLVRLTKVGSRFEREDLFPVRFGRFEEGIAQAI